MLTGGNNHCHDEKDDCHRRRHGRALTHNTQISSDQGGATTHCLRATLLRSAACRLHKLAFQAVNEVAHHAISL
jgi:hypothetical protein